MDKITDPEKRSRVKDFLRETIKNIKEGQDELVYSFFDEMLDVIKERVDKFKEEDPKSSWARKTVAEYTSEELTENEKIISYRQQLSPTRGRIHHYHPRHQEIAHMCDFCATSAVPWHNYEPCKTCNKYFPQSYYETTYTRKLK